MHKSEHELTVRRLTELRPANQLVKKLQQDVHAIEETPSLEELLESWTVFPPGGWENDSGPKDWWAVSNDDGIVAYFGKEADAFRFRLAEINRILNG